MCGFAAQECSPGRSRPNRLLEIGRALSEPQKQKSSFSLKCFSNFLPISISRGVLLYASPSAFLVIPRRKPTSQRTACRHHYLTRERCPQPRGPQWGSNSLAMICSHCGRCSSCSTHGIGTASPRLPLTRRLNRRKVTGTRAPSAHANRGPDETSRLIREGVEQRPRARGLLNPRATEISPRIRANARAQRPA